MSQKAELSPTPRRRTRPTGLFAVGEEHAALRHPFTVLIALAPAGMVAEIWRALAHLDERPLLEAALVPLCGAWAGMLLVGVLGVGCFAVCALRKLPWSLPRHSTLLLVFAWALLWASLRALMGLTSHTLLDLAAVDPIAQTSGTELAPLGRLGLAFSGALGEELVFRALGTGALGLLLAASGVPKAWSRWIPVPVSAIAFALWHTQVLDHHPGAAQAQAAVLVQHLLAGALYGIIFVRQGLAVSTWSHALYNGAVFAGLL